MNSFYDFIDFIFNVHDNLTFDRENKKGQLKYNDEIIEFDGFDLKNKENRFPAFSININDLVLNHGFNGEISIKNFNGDFYYCFERDYIRFIPDVSLIAVGVGKYFTMENNYYFDINKNNMTIKLLQCGYEDKIFPKLKENLKDWNDEYMFYLKLKNIIWHIKIIIV